jgi:hypothetical protein
MDTDDGCIEYAGDEHLARGGGGSIAGVPSPPMQDRVEAFLAKCRAEQSIAPDATGASKGVSLPTLRPRLPSIREIVGPSIKEQFAAMEAETAAKKAQAARRVQLSRALGFAWIEPERLDEYAIEAGISPEKLRAVMATEPGQTAGASMARHLRDSGELLRFQTARATASLVTLIEQGIAEGTVTPAMAPKIVESLAKLTAAQGGAEARNEKSLPVSIEGDLAGLIDP